MYSTSLKFFSFGKLYVHYVAIKATCSEYVALLCGQNLDGTKEELDISSEIALMSLDF